MNEIALRRDPYCPDGTTFCTYPASCIRRCVVGRRPEAPAPVLTIRKVHSRPAGMLRGDADPRKEKAA